MNYRTEQFRSRADRQKDADLCARYGDVKLPAVKASKQVHCKSDKIKHPSFMPKSG